MNQHEDILASFSLEESIENSLQWEDTLKQTASSTSMPSCEDNVVSEENKVQKNSLIQYLALFVDTKAVKTCIFTIKYLASSAMIFVLLLLGTNYQAYYTLAYSYIFQSEMQETERWIMQSVHASNLDSGEAPIKKSIHEETFRVLDEQVELDPRFIKEKHSISRLTQKAKDEHIALDIEITPYENRIVIPRIGKNIPLIDIINTYVDDSDALNDIFMDELEEGVVRYPGSAKPWEVGNSFIFGHSSNFPWMQWDFNDVFALLDNVVYGDEVIVYYDQKKYIYRIDRKDIVKPGNVSVLQNTDKSHELSLMTCWPIGTTLNRLILTWELISVNDV